MPVTEKKKVILSGIQPTGVFTLGNYLGAVKNWAGLQDEFQCAYMIADLHAITARETELGAQLLYPVRRAVPHDPV